MGLTASSTPAKWMHGMHHKVSSCQPFWNAHLVGAWRQNGRLHGCLLDGGRRGPVHIVPVHHGRKGLVVPLHSFPLSPA